MKKWVAIILIGIYLCATTECYQLLKTPMLIAHFIAHCEKNPDTGISSFLAEHYSGEIVYDDDYQQDMQLPFKSCVCLQNSIPPVIQSDIFALEGPVLEDILVEFGITLMPFYPVIFSGSIFQPPRYKA